MTAGRGRASGVVRARRPAVFFDRDGVLNVDAGYVHRRDQFAWIAGAREAIRTCNRRGVLVFVVTNQSGVAHGLYPEDDVARLHAWMTADLAARGAHVDEFAYCPHHPHARLARYRRICDCRKPAPGMLMRLIGRWPVDVERSLLIGDRDSDLQAAAAAGLDARLFDGGRLDDFVERCGVAPGAPSTERSALHASLRSR